MLMSVEEALEHILSAIIPFSPVNVPLSEALGLVLAEDIISQEAIPPFANSAMDGFALLSQDSKSRSGQPPRLRIIGSIAAGYISEQTIEPGTTMRIMTGAPLPPGADSVIQVELTHLEHPESNQVEILEEITPGNNIRYAGEDIQQGQLVLKQGITLGSGEIGILATLGRAQVSVIRRARVAILGTGDEVVDISESLRPGKIRNSNSYLLEAAVREAGAEPHLLGIAKDTVESLREKFRAATQYDLILTSGGVSVGDFDLVKDILQEQGEMSFWRINMRPGKPVAFGHIGSVPLLGLPGNPVSTAVTFTLFGRPLLRKLQGHTRLLKPQIPVIVEDGIQEKAMRRHYVRAHVSWQQDHFVAHTTGNQGSHILTSLLHANALVIVPEGGATIPVGGTAQALMLDWPEQ